MSEDSGSSERLMFNPANGGAPFRARFKGKFVGPGIFLAMLLGAFLLRPASAHAVTRAPMIVSAGATVSSATTAVLEAQINPGGAATTVTIQETWSYRPLPGRVIPHFIATLDTKTEELPAGSKDVQVKCPVTVTHDLAEIDVHYSITASNSMGSVSAPLWTPAAPAIVAPPIPVITVSFDSLNFSELGESGVTVKYTTPMATGSGVGWFEYGRTSAYGMTSGTVPAPMKNLSGGPPVVPIDGPGLILNPYPLGIQPQAWMMSVCEISSNLSGLSPHTTYHIRGAILSGTTMTYSQDATFTTLPRFNTSGDGFTQLLIANISTGQTTLLSCGTAALPADHAPLQVTGSAAGLVIPRNQVLIGQAEFFQNGTLAWVLADKVSGAVRFLNVPSSDTANFPGSNWISQALDTSSVALPRGLKAVAVADLDHDGNPDLVLQRDNGKVFFGMLQGFSLSRLVEGPKLSASFQICAVDDLTGDSKPDLLVWNPATGQSQVIALNGTSFSSILQGPKTPSGWQLMGVGVFVSGESPNWLLYNPKTRETRIWIMKGTSVTAEVSGPTIPARQTLLGTQ